MDRISVSAGLTRASGPSSLSSFLDTWPHSPKTLLQWKLARQFPIRLLPALATCPDCSRSLSPCTAQDRKALRRIDDNRAHPPEDPNVRWLRQCPRPHP